MIYERSFHLLAVTVLPETQSPTWARSVPPCVKCTRLFKERSPINPTGGNSLREAGCQRLIAASSSYVIFWPLRRPVLNILAELCHEAVRVMTLQIC